jgi:hypothetical protein
MSSDVWSILPACRVARVRGGMTKHWPEHNSNLVHVPRFCRNCPARVTGTPNTGVPSIPLVRGRCGSHTDARNPHPGVWIPAGRVGFAQSLQRAIDLVRRRERAAVVEGERRAGRSAGKRRVPAGRTAAQPVRLHTCLHSVVTRDETLVPPNPRPNPGPRAVAILRARRQPCQHHPGNCWPETQSIAVSERVPTGAARNPLPRGTRADSAQRQPGQSSRPRNGLPS